MFQGPDFWWKRIEPGPTPETSWLRSVLKSILQALGRAWDAVWELIVRVLRFLFGRMPGESSGGKLLVWLLAGAILAWAIWKLSPLLLSRLGREMSPRANDVPESQALPAANYLRDEAARALRDGRRAEAIRLALLALIAALEKAGLLRYDTTRTNREYRAELRPRPDLAAQVGRLARIYEGVWYGREPAGRDQAEESIRLCIADRRGGTQPWLRRSVPAGSCRPCWRRGCSPSASSGAGSPSPIARRCPAAPTTPVRVALRASTAGASGWASRRRCWRSRSRKPLGTLPASSGNVLMTMGDGPWSPSGVDLARRVAGGPRMAGAWKRPDHRHPEAREPPLGVPG